MSDPGREFVEALPTKNVLFRWFEGTHLEKILSIERARDPDAYRRLVSTFPVELLLDRLLRSGNLITCLL